jgi:hypothetical protein
VTTKLWLEDAGYEPTKRAEELLQRHGVQIQSWGPFAEGLNGFFTNDTLTGIADVHGKSVAQVALTVADPAWCRRHSQIRTQGADGRELRRTRLRPDG